MRQRHEFALDALGNWSSFTLRVSGSPSTQTRQHNTANEIDTNDNHADTGDSITGTPNYVDPVYDAAGNMTKIPKPSSPTTYGTMGRYDAWNRLVKITADVGYLTIGEYRYDALHRRIAKLTFNHETPNYWDRKDYYYNEDWQVVEERFGGEAWPQQNKETVATDVHTQWLWDARYIDSPVLRWRDENKDDDFADPGEVLYYTTDANMNVTALVDEDSGNVVERYQYDPYGKVLITDANWNTVPWYNSKKNEILYCGYRLDPETIPDDTQYQAGYTAGLYQVRFRQYDPGLGRWMQRDPIGYIAGTNMYLYCGAKPPMLFDPLGLDPNAKAPTTSPTSKPSNSLILCFGVDDSINAKDKKTLKKLQQLMRDSKNASAGHLDYCCKTYSLACVTAKSALDPASKKGPDDKDWGQYSDADLATYGKSVKQIKCGGKGVCIRVLISAYSINGIDPSAEEGPAIGGWALEGREMLLSLYAPRNTLSHELGHNVGCEHTDAEGDLMNESETIGDDQQIEELGELGIQVESTVKKKLPLHPKKCWCDGVDKLFKVKP